MRAHDLDELDVDDDHWVAYCSCGYQAAGETPTEALAAHDNHTDRRAAVRQLTHEERIAI